MYRAPEPGGSPYLNRLPLGGGGGGGRRLPLAWTLGTWPTADRAAHSPWRPVEGSCAMCDNQIVGVAVAYLARRMVALGFANESPLRPEPKVVGTGVGAGELHLPFRLRACTGDDVVQCGGGATLGNGKDKMAAKSRRSVKATNILYPRDRHTASDLRDRAVTPILQFEKSSHSCATNNLKAPPSNLLPLSRTPIRGLSPPTA